MAMNLSWQKRDFVALGNSYSSNGRGLVVLGMCVFHRTEVAYAEDKSYKTSFFPKGPTIKISVTHQKQSGKEENGSNIKKKNKTE